MVNHSAAPIAVVAGEEELTRWRPVLDELPALRHIIILDDDTDDITAEDERFVSYAKLRERGTALHAQSPSTFEQWTDEIGPDDPLSMIYTSGTTGTPKGVVLSHRNAIHEAVAVYALHNAPPHISNIAYLPLAHIAERELSIYMPVVHAGHVHTLADPGDIASALSRVRPDSLFGVPRVWEKMVAGMKSMLTGVPDDRREALLAANELLQTGYKLRSEGKEVPQELADRIAETDRTVLAPIRQMLGLDGLIFASSGAAALPLEVLYFIAGLGVEIHEVWGLSETAGAVTSNCADAFKAGTVGRPIADVEVKVADDGELLVRAPSCSSATCRRTERSNRPPTPTAGSPRATSVRWTTTVRHHHRPEEELIITSGARTSPRPRSRACSRNIRSSARPSRSATIGPTSRRSSCSTTRWPPLGGGPRHRVGRPRHVGRTSRRARRDRPGGRRGQRTVGQGGAGETPSPVDRNVDPDSGELTPTLKLKRRVIVDRYHSDIEALYRN